MTGNLLLLGFGLAGAVLGALLMKSDLALVLLAAFVLALATALVFVPAATSAARAAAE